MSDQELILGDSSACIKQIPDHSIDLILTDPPYNLGRYSTGNIKMSWRKDFNNDVAEWDTPIFNPAEWLDEFRRVLKPTGTIFEFTSFNLQGHCTRPSTLFSTHSSLWSGIKPTRLQ